MTQTISVRLLCFSWVKEGLGAGEVSITLPEGATGEDLEKEVRSRARGVLDGIPLRLARNGEFVPLRSGLEDGDEVALIPPVQGG
ncbi:MAG: MoaD/ThiS family protein [Fidelibacterota bacterium]